MHWRRQPHGFGDAGGQFLDLDGCPWSTPELGRILVVLQYNVYDWMPTSNIDKRLDRGNCGCIRECNSVVFLQTKFNKTIVKHSVLV